MKKNKGWNGLIENTNLENFFKKKNYYKKINPFFPKWETVIINKIYKKNRSI